ncbi:MAG: hypothetical protein N4A57_16095 [Anaeromicrobium sp.]|jgi:hypothetical protein|uniref:hypothetical protein n=1 Tax=Anaeromicrobium sp. TaxID=1929132 RepID=UPI0025FF65A6|nr:hypothetical protein [Anaeromicrobium sp.]MCT4595770.1 hypothetical protein [Anaeromicrobium sp.]
MIVKKLIVALLLIIFLTFPTFGIQYDNVDALLENIPFMVENINLGNINILKYDDTIYVPINILPEKLNYKISIKDFIRVSYPKNYLDFSEASASKGEEFVYGEIISIDKKSNTFHLEQHIDDSSPIIDYTIGTTKDCIIVLKRNDRAMNIGFNDLKVGDSVGVVLTKEKLGRGVILK